MPDSRSTNMTPPENPRPPLPPFTAATAAQKVRAAEDAWNSRDPHRVALAYSPDSAWRNRSEFLSGRDAIAAFLTRKWTRELDSGHWFRSYGNENWEFDERGFMSRRFASINDLPIPAADRKFHWPLGRRPDDHLSLSDLGL